MKISLLHPSRSRVDRSFETIKKWIARSGSGCDYELIVSLDSDDPQVDTYIEVYRDKPAITILLSENRSAVDAINNAAKVATGDIMIVLSDDTDCPDNWAELIEQEVRGKKDFVLRLNDGLQSWLITAPCFDREYYNRFGYVYHPDYAHMFSDCEYTHVANILGRVIKSDLLFKHLHYSVKGLGVKPDEINHRADRTTTQGRNLYLERFRRKFDLPIPDHQWKYPWFVDDDSHLRWLKHHLPR